jgi:hypothetical protein
MKIHRGVASLLKQAGATLVRHSKHYIFQLPNGKKLTVSSTPSDTYAVNNQMREIKQAGGLVEEKRRNPERVEKQGRTDARGRKVTREWLATDLDKVPKATPMAAQLRDSGLVERALRDRIQYLEELSKIWRKMTEERDLQIKALRERQCPCFVCRIRRTFHV